MMSKVRPDRNCLRSPSGFWIPAHFEQVQAGFAAAQQLKSLGQAPSQVGASAGGRNRDEHSCDEGLSDQSILRQRPRSTDPVRLVLVLSELWAS